MNKDKALDRLSTLVHSNTKVADNLKKLENYLPDPNPSPDGSTLEINQPDRNVNGELLLIYFLMFLLMLVIAGFITGVFLKHRMDHSTNNPTLCPSTNISSHNFTNANAQCAYTSLDMDKKSDQPSLRMDSATKRYQNEYIKVSTNNNNELTNLNNN